MQNNIKTEEKKKLLAELETFNIYKNWDRENELFQLVKDSDDAELKRALINIYHDAIGEAWLSTMGMKWSPPEAGFEFMLEYVDKIRILKPSEHDLDRLSAQIKIDYENFKHRNKL